MIEYAFAVFLVVGFIAILKIAGLVQKAGRVIDISKQAFGELRSDTLSEDAKEAAMQSHAKQLAGLFFLITIGGIAAVFGPLAVVWGLDRLHWVSIDGVLDIALSWPFVIATTIIIVLALFVSRAR